jgi:uncharacterized protein (DUF885 family)
VLSRKAPSTGVTVVDVQRASYSIFNANEAESEAAITTEINATWLSRTSHHKIGQLKIGELRQRARKTKWE